MLQARYEKEGMHQYLCMICNESWTSGYANALMQYHTIPFFIPYEIRVLNDSCELYYRLKYRTALSAVLGYLSLDYARIIQIIKSIVGALETAEDYMLSTEQIIWRSEYIFVESDTGKMQFCYYPDLEIEPAEKGDLIHLLTMIMQSIDPKEKDANLLMTEFYQLVTNEECTVDKLIEFTKGRKYNKGNEIVEEELDAVLEDIDLEFNDSKRVKKKNERKIKKRQSYSKETTNSSIWEMVVRSIVIVLSLINVIGIVCILLNRFPYSYTGYLIGSMVAMIIATVVYMNVTKEETPDEIMKQYFEEMDQDIKVEAEKQYVSEGQYIQETNQEKKAHISSGETSLLIGQEHNLNCEIVEEENGEMYYLSSFIKGQYPDIEINSTIVIGRMRAGCNYILKERDISRMHAKITKRWDGITIVDLNSKNGTYINGERIVAGEEIPITAGDAICFANCEFYLRACNAEV